MKITFKSQIDNSSNKQDFEFTEEVWMSKFQDMDVLEFKEPNQGIMNRIEFSKTKVSFFTSFSLIHLNLNEKTEIIYNTEIGQIKLVTFLKKLTISEDKKNIAMQYTIAKKHEKGILGLYKIDLVISE